MKSQVLHTVWCYVPGEAAGEICTWLLLGVKGFMYASMNEMCRCCTWDSCMPAAILPQCSMNHGYVTSAWRSWSLLDEICCGAGVSPVLFICGGEMKFLKLGFFSVFFFLCLQEVFSSQPLRQLGQGCSPSSRMGGWFCLVALCCMTPKRSFTVQKRTQRLEAGLTTQSMRKSRDYVGKRQAECKKWNNAKQAKIIGKKWKKRVRQGWA